MESIKVCEKVMDLLDDKKASDIISIDVRKVTTLTDYFIVCTGASDRLRKALADEIKDKMVEAGIEVLSTEGYRYADWILLDLGFVVVHIFEKETRGRYSLERLWSDGVLTELRKGEKK
ncbi:MAG: ribosome silencing factor [Clostridia bacterium]